MNSAHARTLPRPSGAALLVRTDFTDQRAWKALLTAGSTPSEPDGFLACIEVVDDEAYRDLTAERLCELYPAPRRPGGFFFVADRDAMLTPEHPLLVVPVPFDDSEYAFLVEDEPREMFRVAVAALWSVENNLSLANMDWDEFADNVDEAGVFRGFT